MKELLLAFTMAALAGQIWSQTEIFPSLDSLCEEVFDHQGPAAGVMVSKDGATVYSNFIGLENIDKAAPSHENTVFSMASISKQFTAAGIFVLQKRGELSTDDDIRMYLTDFPSYGSEPIRISHLLNHTSGIRNYNVLAYLGAKEEEEKTNAGIYRLLTKQRGVSNAPNERMLYSNSNYVLLAKIIEKVSGKPFHQFMREELFLALGMESAFFVSDSLKKNPSDVLRYHFDGKNFKNQNSDALVVGPGGMACNLKDLLKWTTVFEGRNGGWPELKAFLVETVTLENGDENTYANGVFVSNYKGYEVVHHSGRTMGSRSQLICVPEKRLSVVIGANTNAYNVVDLSYELLDYFLDVKDAATQQPFKGDFHAERFVGVYQEIHSDLAMTIYDRNDTLFAKSSFGRVGVPLRQLDYTTFERYSSASVTYAFPEFEGDTDLIVDFNGAAFHFEKVRLMDPDEVEMSKYVGDYYSADLDVIYRFKLLEGKLVLSFGEHELLPLHVCREHEFGSFDRTVYQFGEDSSGEILGFTLASEGTVHGIRFEKVR